MKEISVTKEKIVSDIKRKMPFLKHDEIEQVPVIIDNNHYRIDWIKCAMFQEVYPTFKKLITQAGNSLNKEEYNKLKVIT